MMMKRVACFLLVLLLQPALCMADTVILKNGDTFKGVIENKSFAVNTPYGGVRVLNQNVKSIQLMNIKTGRFELLTVNNDLFSGTLAENTIDMSQATGGKLSLSLDRIKRILFDYDGKTFLINTTLYFMKNGDLFSGTLLNKSFQIRTGEKTLEYKAGDFSRMEFFKTDQPRVEALLDNKTFVSGRLLEDRLLVQPQCASRLSLCKCMIRKVQFNAQKLVMVKAIPAAAQIYDSDGDGVLDILDQCPATPKGLPVNTEGCWTLKITHFQFDRAKIRSKFFAPLDEAAKVLKANPQLKVQVQGYTDNRGSAEYNKQLSLKRAEAVVRYLVEKGVKPAQLTAVGCGAKHPIAANDTEKGRAMNRRVQLEQIH